jgi:integrase
MPKQTQFSTSVQRQCYAVIRDVLRYAVAQKLVSRNVALDYSPPGAQTIAERDAGFLTRDEARVGYELTALERKKLMAALQNLGNPKMELRWTLALVYGIRPGEALGICHTDVDYERRELVIRRQVQPLTGKGTVIVPRVKTDSGSRTVPLHDDTLALFSKARHQKRREKRADNWSQYDFDGREFDLVFTQNDGQVISQRLDDAYWRKFVNSAGVKHTRRYVARHNAASVMMATEGVDHISVSNILGHSDPAFTWRKYSHALESKKRNVVDAIGGAAKESVFAWKESLEHEHGREWMLANGIAPNEWDADGELVEP